MAINQTLAAAKQNDDESKSRLDALLTYANGVTGQTDVCIGDAIKTLCDGFAGHIDLREVIVQDSATNGYAAYYSLMKLIPPDAYNCLIFRTNPQLWTDCILAAFINPGSTTSVYRSALIKYSSAVVNNITVYNQLTTSQVIDLRAGEKFHMLVLTKT